MRDEDLAVAYEETIMKEFKQVQIKVVGYAEFAKICLEIDRVGVWLGRLGWVMFSSVGLCPVAFSSVKLGLLGRVGSCWAMLGFVLLC